MASFKEQYSLRKSPCYCVSPRVRSASVSLIPVDRVHIVPCLVSSHLLGCLFLLFSLSLSVCLSVCLSRFTHTHTRTHTHSLSLRAEQRIEQANRIKQKYSDRIPVIAEKYKKSNLPNIEKKKYLLPEDLTVNQFQYVIRQRVKLTSDQALFTYVVHEQTPGKPKTILPAVT